MPILAFNIIYGVLVAFGTGITVGLILSCCYVVGVVQRENMIAKNVALGNRPAH
ncbi:hypothetical protein RchiOBHm_Chr5g0048211 [Rosa chinensis]|uniref:Uncharacterized protein n=1 Tax=Rosa chinensis TaxID=74649 RepID=A0A2P6QEK9_ROSCH|nr:hypothetical protein RchiOBHm_Chr5g0048211 [Rosa chinensis]